MMSLRGIDVGARVKIYVDGKDRSKGRQVNYNDFFKYLRNCSE